MRALVRIGPRRAGVRRVALVLAGLLGAGALWAVSGGLPARASANTRVSAGIAQLSGQPSVAGGGCHLHSRVGRAAPDDPAAPGFDRAITTAAGPAPAPGTSVAGGGKSGGSGLVRPRFAPVRNGTIVLSLPRSARGKEIPAGFLGLSLEYRAIEAYAGQDPRAIDPVLVQLIRDLTPGQAPVIRIGGDSTDWTWWPVPHAPRPPGVSYSITTRWLQVTRALTDALGARLILGINLEADSPKLAAAESRALIGGIGRNSILALEPGNEPELYSSWGWYCADGRAVTGRPAGYDFAAFTNDFSTIAGALPTAPLAGPAIGIPTWFPDLPAFLAAERNVRVVTLHRYPLQNYVSPSSPNSPTVSHLLSDAASQGLAASVAPYVAIAHHHHLPLRIDEMNNVSAGIAPDVANAFASALWIVDALFQMADVGVDGINVHSFPGATYELFKPTEVNRNWRAFVSPEYYGLLMFAQAAPPGSRLFKLSVTDDPSLRAWATRSAHGTLRVVLINDGNRQRVVALKAPGRTAAATLEQLRAPGLHAVKGITLGGQSFGPATDTGLLSGPSTIVTVTPAAAAYSVKLAAASAALLTIP